MNQSPFMQQLDATLLRSHAGEIIALTFGGGSAALNVLSIVTPIVGLIGALLGALAGIYTFRLKRMEYKRAIARFKSESD